MQVAKVLNFNGRVIERLELEEAWTSGLRWRIETVKCIIQTLISDFIYILKVHHF
jgi:hypothetical protein